MPVKPQGIRIDPPPSVPSPIGPRPAAIAAAAPELLPPGVHSRFQGLRVMPLKGLSPNAFQPYSGMVVLPRMTAPVSLSRATGGASSSHGWSGFVRVEPRSVGQPRVKNRSLMVTGTPSSRPTGSPFCQRASEARADLSAPSGSRRVKALSLGSSRSSRCRIALVTSTGDSVFLAKPSIK